MEEAASQAESQVASTQMRGAVTDVDKLTLAQDIEGAKQLKKKIEAKLPDWDQAMDFKKNGGNPDYTFDIYASQPQQDRNSQALHTLGNYIAKAEAQTHTQNLFKAQVLGLERDYGRFVAQIEGYGKSRQGAKTLAVDDAAKIAASQLKSTGIRQGEFEGIKSSPKIGATTAANLDRAERWQTLMNEQSHAVATQTGVYREAQAKLRASLADVKRVKLKRKGDLAQADLDRTIDQGVDAAGKDATEVGTLVEKNIAFVGYFFDAKRENEGKGRLTGDFLASGAAIPTLILQGVFNVINEEANQRFKKKVQTMRGAIANIRSEEYREELTAALNRLDEAEIHLANVGNELVWAEMNLYHAKRGYRRAMSDMGLSADRATGRGDRFEVMGQLVAEADAWMAQAAVVAATAKHEKDNADRSAKDFAALGEGDHEKRTVKYFDINGPIQRGRNITYLTTEREATVYRFKAISSAEVVAKALKDLDGMQKRVGAHAETLRTAFTSKAA